MDIIIENQDGIVTVLFNRPEVRNALTFEMYERVYELCDRANKSAKSAEIKTIIFAGADSSAFASGTDIGLLQSISSGKDGIEYEDKIERVV
jgi:enoyl-CoA hydratase